MRAMLRHKSCAASGDHIPTCSRKRTALFCTLQQCNAELQLVARIFSITGRVRRALQPTAKPAKSASPLQSTGLWILFLEKSCGPKNTKIHWANKSLLTASKTEIKCQKPLLQFIGSSPDFIEFDPKRHFPPSPQKTVNSVSWQYYSTCIYPWELWHS